MEIDLRRSKGGRKKEMAGTDLQARLQPRAKVLRPGAETTKQGDSACMRSIGDESPKWHFRYPCR